MYLKKRTVSEEFFIAVKKCVIFSLRTHFTGKVNFEHLGVKHLTTDIMKEITSQISLECINSPTSLTSTRPPPYTSHPLRVVMVPWDIFRHQANYSSSLCFFPHLIRRTE
uniref:Ovule protein n=1 Tax=Ascaris lumbricoides TaxID=6252 RepID=A0A0M3ILS7_ASCLU